MLMEFYTAHNYLFRDEGAPLLSPGLLFHPEIPDERDSSSRIFSTSKQRKPRSRKDKKPVELAPGQPPTTHGRPRIRVYLACSYCRSRKIKCNGAKPKCNNCIERTPQCAYDAVPHRRGPDKVRRIISRPRARGTSVQNDPTSEHTNRHTQRPSYAAGPTSSVRCTSYERFSASSKAQSSAHYPALNDHITFNPLSFGSSQIWETTPDTVEKQLVYANAPSRVWAGSTLGHQVPANFANASSRESIVPLYDFAGGNREMMRNGQSSLDMAATTPAADPRLSERSDPPPRFLENCHVDGFRRDDWIARLSSLIRYVTESLKMGGSSLPSRTSLPCFVTELDRALYLWRLDCQFVEALVMAIAVSHIVEPSLFSIELSGLAQLPDTEGRGVTLLYHCKPGPQLNGLPSLGRSLATA